MCPVCVDWGRLALLYRPLHRRQNLSASRLCSQGLPAVEVARHGHLAAVQALLDAGAAVDVLDGTGQSVIDHARLCSGLTKASEVEKILTAAELQRQLANADQR